MQFFRQQKHIFYILTYSRICLQLMTDLKWFSEIIRKLVALDDLETKETREQNFYHHTMMIIVLTNFLKTVSRKCAFIIFLRSPKFGVVKNKVNFWEVKFLVFLVSSE